MLKGRPSRARVYAQLDEAVRALNEHLGGLPPPTEAEGIWTEIWHREAHHSTAIEGNTLVYREVRQLLDEGRAVGGKQLREYAEVKGYADAATWVYGEGVQPGDWSTGGLISMTDVRHVHRLVMTPVWDVAPHANAFAQETPGNWRRHDIQPFEDGMKPPSWTEIDAQMLDWLRLVDRVCDSKEPPLPERLAEVHARFECIHPFLDGNGRTGRLLLNLVLVRLGYPPAIIYRRDRDKYMRALHRADEGDYGPLGELLARAVTDNLHRFVMPALSGPERLLPLAALEQEGLSASSLRKAITRGRLRAQQESDGTWLSTKAWVDDYLASRYRRSS